MPSLTDRQHFYMAWQVNEDIEARRVSANNRQNIHRYISLMGNIDGLARRPYALGVCLPRLGLCLERNSCQCPRRCSSQTRGQHRKMPTPTDPIVVGPRPRRSRGEQGHPPSPSPFNRRSVACPVSIKRSTWFALEVDIRIALVLLSGRSHSSVPTFGRGPMGWAPAAGLELLPWLAAVRVGSESVSCVVRAPSR